MFNKFRKNDKGQGLVEFALILPIFLLIFVAIVDFGWVIFVKTNVNNAAREGARYYAVNEDSSEAAAVAANYLSFLNDSSIDVSIDVSIQRVPLSNNNEAGICTVKTSVRPLVGLIFSQPIAVQSSAQMRLEYVFEYKK